MALKSAKPEVSPPVPCAHDLCPHNAILRLKLEHGWANLCRKHYEFHAQRAAKEFCAKNGLESVEQMRTYCMEKARLFGHAGREAFAKVMDEAA